MTVGDVVFGLIGVKDAPTGRYKDVPYKGRVAGYHDTCLPVVDCEGGGPITLVRKSARLLLFCRPASRIGTWHQIHANSREEAACNFIKIFPAQVIGHPVEEDPAAGTLYRVVVWDEGEQHEVRVRVCTTTSYTAER